MWAATESSIEIWVFRLHHFQFYFLGSSDKSPLEFWYFNLISAEDCLSSTLYRSILCFDVPHHSLASFSPRLPPKLARTDPGSCLNSRHGRVIQPNEWLLQIGLVLQSIILMLETARYHVIISYVSTGLIVFWSDQGLLIFIALSLIQMRYNNEVLWVVGLLRRGTHRGEVHSILAVSSTTVRSLVREAHWSRVNRAIPLGLILRLWFLALLGLRQEYLVAVVALSSRSGGIGHMLVAFNHFLVWKRQSWGLVLRSVALICNDPFQTLLVVNDFVDFFASFTAEIHALNLLGWLLEWLPVLFNSSTVDRLCLLRF